MVISYRILKFFSVYDKKLKVLKTCRVEISHSLKFGRFVWASKKIEKETNWIYGKCMGRSDIFFNWGHSFISISSWLNFLYTKYTKTGISLKTHFWSKNRRTCITFLWYQPTIPIFGSLDLQGCQRTLSKVNVWLCSPKTPLELMWWTVCITLLNSKTKMRHRP